MPSTSPPAAAQPGRAGSAGVGRWSTARRRPDAAPEAVLNSLDRRIVAVLQQGGRGSHTDVARQHGGTETTILARIKRLLETGSIQVVAIPITRDARQRCQRSSGFR